MSLPKLFFQVWILSAFLTAASIYPPVQAQETLIPGLNDRDIGISLFRQGNTESAIRALSDAVQKDKLDVDAWYYLGLACNTVGNSKCARKAFAEAVKLRPDFPEARTGLAYTFLRLKKMKEAVGEAERALTMKSGQETAHYVIGAVRLRQNSYLAASEQADAALKSKPNFPPALLLKSQALFRLYLAEISSDLYVANREIAEEVNRRRLAYVTEAAAALEQYIRLESNANDIKVWREQLETLQAYATESFSDVRVFSGSEVKTMAIVKRKPEPQFTEEARGNGVTGTVVLRAIFAADGTVRAIRTVKGLPDGLTEVAIAAARKIKFIPATKDGRPVSIYVQIEYNFNLY